MKRVRFKNHWHGWFYDETYRANVDVIWPVNAKQIAEFTKHRYSIPLEESQPFGAKCVNVTEGNGRQTQLICLAKWPLRPDAHDHSFLAHECLHAVSNILDRRGMPLVPHASIEAYTFLLESLVRRCLQVMNTSRRLP